MGCCQALSGIARDCGNSIGGIKRAWAACYDQAQTPTVTGGQITAFPTGIEWHEYEFRRQTGSVTSTITRDDTSGTLYYENAIVLQFLKQETTKRIEINALAQSDTVWAIEDNNDKIWYLGFDFPVSLNEGTAETGTALGDFNGYNITLNDLSRELPYEVTGAAKDSLLNPESGS